MTDNYFDRYPKKSRINKDTKKYITTYVKREDSPEDQKEEK